MRRLVNRSISFAQQCRLVHSERVQNHGMDGTPPSQPTTIRTKQRGLQLLQDPFLNRGTAFTQSERDQFGLRGLLPPRVQSMESQMKRILNAIRDAPTSLHKYSIVSALMDRNTILFYRLLERHFAEMAPIIYTPTVGRACLDQHNNYRRTRGMYFCVNGKNKFTSMVYNWPYENVDVIVATDGSRILALGDLGSNGMNIPIGKLALYVAGGGIDPKRTLPVVIDVGTDNVKLRENELYNGLTQPRIRGAEYWEYIDEWMNAIRNRWPNALVQFEDFASNVALPMLNKYRHTSLCFNDDIQSTGTIALATLLASLRTRGMRQNGLGEERIVCLGAGSAGLGVCNAIARAMMDDGASREEALSRFYIVDDLGLLGKGRDGLTAGQSEFKREDMDGGMCLEAVVSQVQPTVLLGLSGVGGLFTECVVREMSKHVERPVVMPLSNPSSHAECSAEDAFRWTDGRAIFASGSPFQNVKLSSGALGISNQCNNAYSFPGIGLATSTVSITRVTDGMMLAAARTIAQLVPDDDVVRGRLLPSIDNLRMVSLEVAAAIVKVAHEEGVIREALPESILCDGEKLKAFLACKMWRPEYPQLVPDW